MVSSSCGVLLLRLISVGCLFINVFGERLEDIVSQASNHTTNKSNASDPFWVNYEEIPELPELPDTEAPHGGSSQDPPSAKQRPVGLLQESGEVVFAGRHRHDNHATGGEGFHGQFEGHFDGHFLGDFHGNMDGHFEGEFADR
eukprot:TRINITY_DN1473_c0_g1_i1.p1 TRINITY_DN1473_c0_g1~~TRINITY_DN1473_c0_g1_i1.p1  ORF type:complete len:168 (+),score=21.09 TRINITY_DN1473_c0_g1_i1:76-504(+)